MHIRGSLPKSIGHTTQVKIRNTCLLDIPDQSNIIQLKYADQLRDFRMTDSRQEIEVDL